MAKTHSRHPLTLSLLATLGLGVVGCAEPEQAGPPTEGIELPTTTLAEIDVGYGTIQFQQLTAPDGSKTVGMIEIAPGTLKTTPGDLLFEQGGLTALEAFKAIAPERPVPLALAETHAAQAAALGRPDTSVHPAVFNKDLRTGMAVSVEACEGFIYENTSSFSFWTSRLGYTNVSGPYWLNVGTVIEDWSYATTANVTMGLCNNSDAEVWVRYAYDNPNDAYGWFYSGSILIHPVDAFRYWNFSQASNYTCSGGGTCPRVATRYGVGGNSPIGKSIHMRTAVSKILIIQPVPPVFNAQGSDSL